MLVAEGQHVRKGDPLVTIDDSVERASTEQLQAQAQAALAMLHELKAEPRPEALAVASAQVDNARATLKNARDQLAKEEHSYRMDPKAVSKNDLDNATNAERIAATNLGVVQKQYLSCVARCLAAAISLSLSGCAVGPNFHRPAAPPVTHYGIGGDPRATSTAEGIAQHFTPGANVAADWWRLFNSMQLQALIADALANNPGLAATQASLRASEDSLRAGYGIFYPQVRADAAATRERLSPLQLGESARGGVFNLFTLSASASYALDVFGGERRELEGLAAQVDFQRAAEHAARIALLANIVNTVIAKAAYRAEITATGRLIELQKEQVRLAQIQYESGTQPYSNVLSLRSQLASYEATIPQLEQKLAQSNDLLATLVGRVPAAWSPPEIGLKDLRLPADLPVSLPSDLVRQRPDILAAEATAHAASANVGVATAALLPNVTLSGAFSTNSRATSQLFAAEGRAWSFGATVGQPLFEGGTLWLNRKAAVENYTEAMDLYRQTVLGAFGQVADALRALDNDAASLRAEDDSLAAARQALHLVQINYTTGLDTYLDVLSADTLYHQATINQLEAVAVRYQDTVALYVALGGGWWSGGGSSAIR